MRYIQLKGILKEAIEQYPEIELCSFLSKKLQVPPDKAEELASRIEKQICPNANKTQPSIPKTILEERLEAKELLKPSVYSIGSLSEKEFEHFITWLLQELGFKIQETYVAKSGTDVVATRDDEKILIQARKYPDKFILSDSIVWLSWQAQRNYGCNHSIILSPTHFSMQAIKAAEKLGLELWDRDVLDVKISEVCKNANVKERYCFPKFKGSLLESLLGLAETKDFFVETRANKYDLFLRGIRYPLLTFEGVLGRVTSCVFRIKYNEPVSELNGTVLIGNNQNTHTLDDAYAYDLIIQYLDELIE
ncbi:MAG: restriction endonuclease [Candidatus Bathyarchaeota archaeon]|nr:restriction endonuclease [Candidatus Bathyarchaeota archaeon]